jgi:hypothetical protein
VRQLASLIHLIVTAWAAYIAPTLLLVALTGFFPRYPEAAYTATYVAMALAAAFVGGTILGRTPAWRGRVALLTGLLWLLALAVSVPTLVGGRFETAAPDDLVAPVVLALAPVFLALGMTLGLFVGVRFLRQYDHTSNAPKPSLGRTREQ